MPKALLPLTRTGFLALKRVQAAAGLVLASFIALHAGNAAAGLWGEGARSGYLLAMRGALDAPWVEGLWVGAPLAVHATAGLLGIAHERALRRRALAALAARGDGAKPRFGRRAPTARLHRLTGVALLALVPAHVFAMRFGGLGLEGAGYARAADLVRRAPALGRAWLAALAVAAGYHMGYGVWMALVNLGVLRPGLGRRLGFTLGMALGCATAAAALAGLAALGGA